MDELLTQQLRELDRERLVELIASLHGRDPAIDREIAAFAARRVPSKHESKVRSWIQELTGRRGGSSRFEAFHFGSEIDRILKEIEVLIGGADPETTLELVEQVFKAGRRLIETVDDSDADISMSLQDVAPLWLKAARRCRETGIERDWAAWLEALLESDGYGLLDRLLPNASILLTEMELRLLAERYEARAGREEDEFRRRHWLNLAGALAWPLRDPGLFVRAERLIAPVFNAQRLEAIAKCFLELGDPQGGLEWLESPWPERDWGRTRLLAQAYGDLGRVEEQIAVIRSIWDESPSVGSLEDLLVLLSPEEKERAKEVARARAAGIPNLETALELLLFLERTTEAAELCFERHRELKGESYYTLKEIAERFESNGHPLAASLIYRALLDSILARGYSRAYHHAADYYEQLRLSATRIGDWREEPDHPAYCADLRYRHGRKYGFWSRVKD